MVGMRDGQDMRSLFTHVALDRARVLAPIVVIAIAGSLVASQPTNIPLTPAVIAVNLGVLAALAMLAIALLARRVPEGWSHVACAALWWAPVTTTLASQYVTHEPTLLPLMLLEISTAAMLLHRGWTLASFAVLDVIWLVLELRDDRPDLALRVTVVPTAQLFAFIMQALIRRSLVQAEGHRRAEAATAAELAHRIVELESSEAERARLNDQLWHVQRMEAVGTLAAGLAHDMNNVLAAITSFTELMLQDVPDAQMRADLEDVLREAERGAALTRGLLAFSRRGQYRKQTLAIETVVDDVIPLLARTLPKTIEIETDLELAGAHVEGDPAQLAQALVNLALNAADAMPDGGKLAIAGDVVELETAQAASLVVATGRYARIRVADTGTGMDDATRRRVFEPFFTTKPQGKGTGLGLSLVWGAIQGHHGAVTVDSAPGAGSTFSIYLPLGKAPVVAAIASSTSGRVCRRGIALVADDEPQVRASTRRMLERLGLAVITAADGRDALELFDKHRAAISLVVLDMGMPVVDGRTCFRELRRRSSVPVLIATGYAVDEDVQELVAAGAALLEKPYGMEALATEIDRLLGPEALEASSLGS
jgi:signal transduction histidine kinase/CheY-like chemotaxis protein